MSIGTTLHTFLHGSPVGRDAAGNAYYQARRLPPAGERRRRWVIYAGEIDSTAVPAEWHAWLHYTTDAPLPDTGRKPWQKTHIANQTGTAQSYRPPGHDYAGGTRAASGGDYEAWTPDTPAQG